MPQVTSHINIPLDIGQMLMLGFAADNSQHEHFKILTDFTKQYALGGVVFFRYNIINPEQTTRLLTDLQQNSCEPILLAVDQEGGKVQRLTAAKGFKDHFSAKHVASCFSASESYQHYLSMSTMLRSAGFNFNFAPCVDLDCEPACPVIGALERSFSSSKTQVVEIATDFIKAHRHNKVLTCLKHFPGHGHAKADTHHGIVDITNTWTPAELEPFKMLCQQGLADSVMLAHVTHNGIHADTPASLSKIWVDKLRNDLKFDGLIVSDCYHMGAILAKNSLEEIIIKAINAGVDLLVFSNNPAAAASVLSESVGSAVANSVKIPDPELPLKFREIVLNALKNGQLAEDQLKKSIERVVRVKQLAGLL